jgi:hypothetical protein
VPDAPLSSADLAALLERFRLRPQEVPTAAAASRAQLELAFARISALSEAVGGGDAPADDAVRLAMRLLLMDLGFVSAWFRGEASEKASALARVLDRAPIND